MDEGCAHGREWLLVSVVVSFIFFGDPPSLPQQTHFTGVSDIVFTMLVSRGFKQSRVLTQIWLEIHRRPSARPVRPTSSQDGVFVSLTLWQIRSDKWPVLLPYGMDLLQARVRQNEAHRAGRPESGSECVSSRLSYPNRFSSYHAVVRFQHQYYGESHTS